VANAYRVTPHHTSAPTVVFYAHLRQRLRGLDMARIDCLQVGQSVDVPLWADGRGACVTRLPAASPRHVRPNEIEPGTQLPDGRTVSAWRLATTPGNRFNSTDGETWTDGYVEFTDGTTEHVVVMQVRRG
jgi:hypothetical protein